MTDKPSFIRAKRDDGVELTINLMELTDALEGGVLGAAYFLLNTGRVIFVGLDDEDDGEVEISLEDPDETLEIDPIPTRTQFQWMEDFIDSVRSIPAKNALRDGLRQKKPFRHFKDALAEFPLLREKWFQFQADQMKQEAAAFIGSLGWDVLEVVDSRSENMIEETVDPAENVPITAEEHDWILRGAWQVAASGGRTQLALLLKGSRNKDILKHGLDHSPIYGKLSFLTIEEIENRIDNLIRKGELRTEFFGKLPLILLTDESWERVRSWAHRYECELASLADEKVLKEVVDKWRYRRREEQNHLLEAACSMDAEATARILRAWSQVAGKDMRSKIETKLATN
jgi:hypothetical protein